MALSKPHDWHSGAYFGEWIMEDAARDPVRRPRLRAMLKMAPFARDARVSVLDVGAGYGAVTEELLRLFPEAEVTLQDYSTPMLDAARRRLAPHADQLRYVACDLTDPNWAQQVGGLFDLAVSAICLHNLRNNEQIFACYRAIHDLLKPGGWFLDDDLFFDGVAPHVAAMRQAGFARVECCRDEPPRATVMAIREG